VVDELTVVISVEPGGRVSAAPLLHCSVFEGSARAIMSLQQSGEVEQHEIIDTRIL